MDDVLLRDYHTSGCLRTTSGSDGRTVVYKSSQCWHVLVRRSPLGGLALSFLGLAYDGLTLGYQANVLAAVATGGQGHLTVGVEGVENPACR